MENNDSQKSSRYYVPFHIIVKAVSGNPVAIMKTVQYFDGFITKASYRPYNIFGGGQIYLSDPELKDELIIRLIEAILKFKM